MPALKATSFEAEIVWLGRVADSQTDLSAAAVRNLELSFAGPEREYHSGLTRSSCSRVAALYARGTEIANTRQLSVVSQEELEQIAVLMELDRIDPAWLGASVVVNGLPDFTHVPPGSRLQAPDGATLTVDMENRPCVLPGRVVERVHPGYGPKFKMAAQHQRGVTAWVECPGTLNIGDTLRLFVPDQPNWALLDVARAE